MTHKKEKMDLAPSSLMSLVLSFISLIIVSWLLFFPANEQTKSILFFIDQLICSLFFIQWNIDLLRSKHKKEYVKTRWLDLIASLPLIESLRYIRLFQIIRVIRVMHSGHHLLTQIRNNRQEMTFVSILLLLVFLICFGSLFILIAESPYPNATIKTPSDALWWALITISTVGYGDYTPVSLGGRLFAAIMIICGVGMFGMISGLVTSFVNPSSSQKYLKKQEKKIDTLLQQQNDLLNKVEQLGQQLEAKKQNNSI